MFYLWNANLKWPPPQWTDHLGFCFSFRMFYRSFFSTTKHPLLHCPLQFLPFARWKWKLVRWPTFWLCISWSGWSLCKIQWVFLIGHLPSVGRIHRRKAHRKRNRRKSVISKWRFPCLFRECFAVFSASFCFSLVITFATNSFRYLPIFRLFLRFDKARRIANSNSLLPRFFPRN